MLAFDLQEAAHGRLCHVDVFQLHLYLIYLLVGLLLATKFAKGAEERGSEGRDHLHDGSAFNLCWSVLSMGLTLGSLWTPGAAGRLADSCRSDMGL